MDLMLQRYYEDRESMVASQGWKDLMTDVKEMMAATNTLSGVTVDTLQFKQGEVSIMRWLLSLAEVSAEAYEELKRDENAA